MSSANMLLTTEIDLDDVLSKLEESGNMDPGLIKTFFKQLPENLLMVGIRVLLCLLVFWLGSWIIGILRKIVKKSMTKAKADPGVISFTDSFLKASLYVILVVLILAGFGVNATSLAAVLGSAGVAIGLAIQGSLSNFAGGVLILLQKPFRVGDYIYEDAHKNEGVVQEIKIFYTRLKTAEGRMVILPNGELSNTSITNYTFYHPEHSKNVKVSLITIGVSYQSDLRKVKEVLLKLLENEPLRAKERPYSVRIKEYGESSVNFLMICEFPLDQYYAGVTSLMDQIKPALDENGISIPFPQVDVHMIDK